VIEPVWIRIVTVVVLFVGFGLGYLSQRWADRVKAQILLRKATKRAGRQE
jgi:hypothetical protein